MRVSTGNLNFLADPILKVVPDKDVQSVKRLVKEIIVDKVQIFDNSSKNLSERTSN